MHIICIQNVYTFSSIYALFYTKHFTFIFYYDIINMFIEKYK